MSVTTTNRRGERVLRTGQTGDQLIGVVLVIVLASAIAFIGVDVLDEIQGQITDTDLSATDDANQTQFENATEEVSIGFADAMGLMDIVFIILMFSVILGALLAFRR